MLHAPSQTNHYLLCSPMKRWQNKAVYGSCLIAQLYQRVLLDTVLQQYYNREQWWLKKKKLRIKFTESREKPFFPITEAKLRINKSKWRIFWKLISEKKTKLTISRVEKIFWTSSILDYSAYQIRKSRYLIQCQFISVYLGSTTKYFNIKRIYNKQNLKWSFM